nr:B474 [uncultured bacterium]
MNTKMFATTATGIVLVAFALGAAASDNMGNRGGKAGHEPQIVNPHKESQGNHSPASGGPGNANSNRQADPGSTRGLERAQERRSEQADEHAQSGREHHWYDFLFGDDGDRDNGKDRAKREPRWWWPFD